MNWVFLQQIIFVGVRLKDKLKYIVSNRKLGAN